MSRNILYVLAGAISVLAFSPFHLWWMAVVSLSLLLLLLSARPEPAAFRAGYLYGMGMFATGTSWIFNSLYDYGNAPLAAAVAMTVVGTLVLSVFPALVVKLYVHFSTNTRHGLLQAASFVCLWVLFEWLRSWILTGFPWLLLGHTLVDSPIAGVIPVLGVFGGSALIVIIAASIHQAAMASQSAALKWLLAAIVVMTVSYFLNAVDWTHKTTQQPVKVAAVQANIPFAMKWDKDRHHEVYQAYVDLTRRHWDSDIIVWPETAIPTFYRVANQDFIPRLTQELNQHQVELISGVFTYQPGTEYIFNSLVTLGGNEVEIYSKQHLVPFGEYLPMRWLFEFFRHLVTIPMSDLSPGEGPSVVTLKGVPTGVSICYEAAYGEEILRALPQAELLINVTNDAWFGDSFAPHQHLQIARTRALETGRYMVRAANTGISAIIDPKGQITQQSAQFVDDVVAGEIWPMAGNTPFIHWGNWAIISSLSFGLLLLLLAQRQSLR